MTTEASAPPNITHREPTLEELKQQLTKAVKSYHEHEMFRAAVLSGCTLVTNYLDTCPNVTPAMMLEAIKGVAKDMGFLPVVTDKPA